MRRRRVESTDVIDERGDIDEAMNASRAVGDDRLQRQATAR